MKFGKIALVTVSWSVFKAVDDSDLDFKSRVTLTINQGKIWSKWDIDNGLNRQQKVIQRHIDVVLANDCTHIQFRAK